VREDAATKGRRLLVEARLSIVQVGGGTISARCRSDSAEVYSLGFDKGHWFCNCDAVGRCSHLIALQLVTLRPSC